MNEPLRSFPPASPLAPAPTPPAPGAPALEALGEHIAQLSAEIQAATYQLLVMLREFDERDGWTGGFRSCAHWLNWRTGVELGAAREKVRVARALASLPRIAAAMERGQVSFSKVRALTRVATPENEEELLGFARACTAAHVERLVRSWRRIDRLEEKRQEARRHESRYLHVHTDEDGMVVLRARLTPEAGALVLKALDAAEQKLFDTARETRDEKGDGVPIEQRRADALALVAESGLAAGLDPGTRGDRYQVVVHVDAEALPAGSDVGGSALDDGTHVSAETSRRLGCDAALVVMRHGADGGVLDVGRRKRTIPPALRRALEHRDRGCRFPGCGVRVCEGHHVEHWAHGGETRLDNLVLLCRRHHRAVHEEGFRVVLAGSEARFHRPDGRPIEAAPAMAAATEPAGMTALERLLDAEWNTVVDGEASLPVWAGERVDYGMVIEHLYRSRDGRRPETG